MIIRDDFHIPFMALPVPVKVLVTAKAHSDNSDFLSSLNLHEAQSCVGFPFPLSQRNLRPDREKFLGLTTIYKNLYKQNIETEII